LSTKGERTPCAIGMVYVIGHFVEIDEFSMALGVRVAMQGFDLVHELG
jgi:hypothetical protein